jgi:hypothetical protein
MLRNKFCTAETQSLREGPEYVLSCWYSKHWKISIATIAGFTHCKDSQESRAAVHPGLLRVAILPSLQFTAERNTHCHRCTVRAFAFSRNKGCATERSFQNENDADNVR